MRRDDVEHLKSFLSRQIDRARMAYGRLPKVVPRQYVIVGTTNSEQYLKDGTGKLVVMGGIEPPTCGL